ncbi:TPA: hypothetical protein OUF25_000498 [Enterobacter hormaechei]|nr:hypothetical protein [Enterobacter hormaechei]
MSVKSTVAPGYCVVQQAGTLDFQARLLFNKPDSAGKIHEHARIYRLRSVAGSQILNFMS